MQWLRHTRGGLFTTEWVREKKRRGETVLSRLSLTAFVIPLALGLGIGGISSAEESLYDPDVVLVMKDKYFHVIKGAQPGNPLPNPAFSLPVGRDIVIGVRASLTAHLSRVS